MKHLDEDILLQIAKKQNFDYIVNNNFITIGHKAYEFQPIKVFDDIVSLLMPKEFQKMDDDGREEKYLTKYRPQIVYTDSTDSMNFCFSYLDVPIESNQLSETLIGFKSAVKQKNPAVTFYDDESTVKANPPHAWFDYRTNVMDGEAYIIMYVTIIKDKLLICNFNTKIENKKDYKLFALKVLNSIEETRDING